MMNLVILSCVAIAANCTSFAAQLTCIINLRDVEEPMFNYIGVKQVLYGMPLRTDAIVAEITKYMEPHIGFR